MLAPLVENVAAADAATAAAESSKHSLNSLWALLGLSLGTPDALSRRSGVSIGALGGGLSRMFHGIH